MIQLATVDVPVFLHMQAAHIACERTKRNAHITDPYYNRGDLSQYLDYVGILAELAVRWWCDTNGIRYEATPILAESPISEYDIRFNGVTYDVKGMDSPKKVYVNERAHIKKKCESYLFVLLENNAATIFKATYTEVDRWPVKQLAYTPAYVGKLPTEDF